MLCVSYVVLCACVVCECCGVWVCLCLCVCYIVVCKFCYVSVVLSKLYSVVVYVIYESVILDDVFVYIRVNTRIMCAQRYYGCIIFAMFPIVYCTQASSFTK